MILSEAIRLGAMLKPQGFEACVVETDQRVYTCAIGAAMDAVGKLDRADPLDYPDCFPEFHAFADCPCGCLSYVGQGDELEAVIVHLNDYHMWTRERIADWVDTVIPVPVSESVIEEVGCAVI